MLAKLGQQRLRSSERRTEHMALRALLHPLELAQEILSSLLPQSRDIVQALLTNRLLELLHIRHAELLVNLERLFGTHARHAGERKQTRRNLRAQPLQIS